MAEIVGPLIFLFAFLGGTGMALSLLFRPEYVISIIFRTPMATRPEMAPIMRPVARLWPYSWIYERESYDEIVAKLRADPLAYPGLTLLIRIMGGAGVTFALIIVTLTVVLVIAG